MNIATKRFGNLSAIIIDNFFTPQELHEVETEVNDLRRFLAGAETTHTAVDENKKLKKTGTGVFLDGLYGENREASAILQYNRKLFSEEIVLAAKNFDAVFGFIRESNLDTSLLNSYVSGQEYKAHTDSSRISAVTFLRQGDFTGGGFRFPAQDIEIEAVHNRAVVFPSCVLHQALPIFGNGARVSIAQFIDNGK
tara:strand:+ start:4651 stop:5235 length:585 start_codon:yes stop_codon:yes gene_type:complete